MNPHEFGKSIHILLVEDNPGDVRLVREALKDRPIQNLSVVRDGEEAMDFLCRRKGFAGALRPDLVLLDLNLPKKDGRDVLQEIKSDPALRRIPVVVWTTSDAEKDILKSYDLHANCYITKPADVDKFIAVIHSIVHFWVTIVKLPFP